MPLLVGRTFFDTVERGDYPSEQLACLCDDDLIRILLTYVVLGMFMDGLAMLVVTTPIFFPIVMGLGFDPIWFGIFAVMVTELSLITPPVGLNLFVIRTVIGNVSIGAIYRGIVPFVVADIVRILLIVLFPALVLFLPMTAR